MTTNTNASSSIMELIDAYAESRHVNGAPHYNARTAEARAAVAAALASPGAVAAPAPAPDIELKQGIGCFECHITHDPKDCPVGTAQAAEGAAAAEPAGWQPIATAPKNRTVLAGYRNSHGHWRTVRACYYPADSL